MAPRITSVGRKEKTLHLFHFQPTLRQIIPSLAALAMLTISVTFGVNFAKNGILMALRIHRQMFRTNSGSCKNNKFDYFFYMQTSGTKR